MTDIANSRRQKGAALIIVLLLVATLAFIVLAISQQTAIATRRSLNADARSELFWREIGVEALTVRMLETALELNSQKVTLDSELFTTPFHLPMEDGAGRIRFEDLTTCFNVNSLVVEDDTGRLKRNENSESEFTALLESINLGAGRSASIAATIIDWIDNDGQTLSGGAEDGFYTALPAPYRTGGALLADIGEMRAMKGVAQSIFEDLRPFLCVLPDSEPSRMNINLMTPAHAPLLVGLLEGEINRNEASNIIAQRPPGGFGSEADFIQSVEKLSDNLPEGFQQRVALTSQYYKADATLTYGSSQTELTMKFRVDEGGKVRIFARHFGVEQ